MDTLYTTFLLIIAAISAILTYAILPRIPVVLLASASAVALAGGVWWHLTQFSWEYRTSTWQEQLRNYAGFVMVFAVIVISYGFYAVFSTSAMAPATKSAMSLITQATAQATESVSALQETMFGIDEDEGYDDVVGAANELPPVNARPRNMKLNAPKMNAPKLNAAKNNDLYSFARNLFG